jgi:hypothetical protein
MKKLFLSVVLVVFVPFFVQSDINNVVKKSVMGIGGTTAVAALAMIAYQSHIIKKLKKEKVMLQQNAFSARDAAELDNSVELVIPVYDEVEKNIREAYTLRAEAIAVLGGATVLGGTGYLWPIQKKNRASQSSSEPNKGLLPESSPGSLLRAGANATGLQSLSSASDQATASWKTQAEFDDFAVAHILSCAEEHSISDDKIAVPDTEDGSIITCLHDVGVNLTKRLSKKEKDAVRYIAWPRQKRSSIESINVALPTDFYAAAQVNSLGAQRLPLDCFDIVHVPADGNCGAHVACLFQSNLLTAHDFCPVFQASLSSIMGLRRQLVEKLEELLKGARKDFWARELELREGANSLADYKQNVGLEGYTKELAFKESAFPKHIDSKYWLADFDFMLLAEICKKTFIIWEEVSSVLQVNNVCRPESASGKINLEHCVHVVNTRGVHWYSVVPKIGLDDALKQRSSSEGGDV